MRYSYATSDEIEKEIDLVHLALKESFVTDLSPEQIEALLTNPFISILFAWGPEAVGVSVVSLPMTKEDKIPQVIAFYTDRPGVRLGLAKATVDFIHKHGYTTFWAINTTKKPDNVWSKAFTPKNWVSSPIGSIMEFKING